MDQSLSFIGKNIRFYRRSRNWTLKQLASKIGIQEGPLGRIERGQNLPSAAVIFQLSQVLNIPTDAIFASRISEAQAVVETDSLFMTTGSESLPAPLIDACREIMTAFHCLEVRAITKIHGKNEDNLQDMQGLRQKLPRLSRK